MNDDDILTQRNKKNGNTLYSDVLSDKVSEIIVTRLAEYYCD